jgi:hypothetical protein
MTASLAQTILDYIRALIWPSVVLTLVLFFLIAYEDNVRALIDAIRELRGPAGVGAALAPRGQPQPPDIDEPEQVDEQQAELVALVVEEYEAQMAQAQEQHQEQVERIINELVVARLELDFERQYQWIFGSQLRALRALRDARGQLPRAALEPIYEAVRPQLWSGFTFDTWIGYLLRVTLHSALAVAVNGGTYHITPKGRAFLGYIERLKYPDRSF